MPKHQAPESNRRRPGASRRPGFLSLLLFWPLHLFAYLTRRMPPFRRFVVRLVAFPLLLALVPALVLGSLYGMRAARFDLERIHEMPERSIVRDRLGEEIGRIHAEKRKIVPLQHVAEDFRKAILAREDARFYRHGAFDTIGIVRAISKNMQGKREGASTITQQLVSDVFQLKRGEKRGDILRQLDRKCLEIAIAVRLEAKLEKDEILEAYINQINWGRQIKGVAEASRIYFEKHPAELSLSESALLAGIVRGPDSFNPFKSMDAATRERDTTLTRMVTAGVITQAQADAAREEPIEVRPMDRRRIRESYAMDLIRRELEIILEKEDIELGGLEIITTLDLRVQQKAEEALEAKLREVEGMRGYAHPTRPAWQRLPEEDRGDPKYIQGATVVIENRTGGVLAVVGGRDARESKFNRAHMGDRQLGSIFKPFLFLTAFERGLRPDSPISDGPLQPGEIRGGGGWRPKNADGVFGGIHSAATGLIRSRNTMSVRVGNHAGLENVAETARMVGFDTPMPESPVAFLGSWNASAWEVASSYSIFPNEGVRYRPYLIAQIKDRDGNILHSNAPMPYQAAPSRPALEVSRILGEVTTRGTAASVRRLGFDKPCGGKTGTTNDYKDAWFAGYTSTLTCAVWVGFDRPKTTIHRGFGSVLALPVWVDIMKTADRLGYKAGELHSRKLVEVEICRLSGKRATAGCRSAGTAAREPIQADSVPEETDFCPHHPARATAIDPSALAADTAAPRARPVVIETPPAPPPAPTPPPRARPVDDPPPVADVPPPRALPVE